MEKEPSTKFYGVFVVFKEVMKYWRLEGLNVGDIILRNFHNIHCWTLHDILEQEFSWFMSLENIVFVIFIMLLFCLCVLEVFCMFEALIYDEHIS